MAKNVRTQSISEPLDGASIANADIDVKDGNLTIDGLTGSGQLLATGTLQYMEKQGLPTRSVITNDGETTLTLKANSSRTPWFHMPWSDCNGATEWQIHLNPRILSGITAHSSGGNVRLNLEGMAVTRLSADTGGGNMDVILPDNAANLNINVRTGAGNVTLQIGGSTVGVNHINASSGAGNVVVQLPDGLAALIHASSGMGKTILDPHFAKIDSKTYQSPGYDDAADRVEITLHSGVGNVIVK